MSKLCQWFGVPRRTLYYRPTKATPAVDPRFAEPIKAMIEENPSSGYRIVAHLLDFNKNTVQRIFQLNRLAGEEALNRLPPSRASPAVRSTGAERTLGDGPVRIWAGRDQWSTLALVIDCHTRELLGWNLSRSGKAKTAEAAL